MNSAGGVILGSQRPRYRTAPDGAAGGWGPEAIDLARSVGIELDPGQCDVISDGMAVQADGRWLSSEVADIEPRQNGKGVDLEVRALAGALLVKEPLIIWTAHEFKTAHEGFLRMKHHFTEWDHLRKRVRAIRSSTQATEIELMNPTRRISFLARSGGSGRGFAEVSPLFLDEAFALTAEQVAALIFAMSAHPNPQVWYMSSAPLLDSPVLREICIRGRKGSAGLVYYEWSSSGEHAELAKLVADNKALSDEDAASGRGLELRERLFAKAVEANRSIGRPGGVGVTLDSVLREMKSAGVEQFLRERLGIFVEELVPGWQVIPQSCWTDQEDPDSQLEGRPAVGVYVPPDRRYSAIAVAGARAAGGKHLELAANETGYDFRPGTKWLVPRLIQMDAHNPSVLVIDDKAIADEAEAAGLVVHRSGAADVVTGCQLLYDGIAGDDIAGRDVHHLGQEPMTEAAKGAIKRNVGNSWAWERRDLTVDVAPLAAASLALFGHCTPRVHRPEAPIPMMAWR